MAQQEKVIQTFTGQRLPMKRIKAMLARAKTAEERAGIKALALSEPVRVFAKTAEVAQNPVDAALAASED